MNQRERTLAMVVGVLVAGTVLYYGGQKVAKALTSRSDKIKELEDEVETKEIQRLRGVKASRLLNEYATRALPGDPEFANSRYRDWLLQWVESAEITGADVKWVNQQIVQLDKEHAHDIHNFSVICTGELPQLVTLLYEFYSQDYLHRIKSLTAKPIKDKQLSLKFMIEAIAIPTVSDKILEDMPSKRLALKSIDDYRKVIVGRNLYSPANLPPNFADVRTERGYVNRPMRFKPDVKDPDGGRLTYRVENNGLEGLRIDERSGEIEWTPSEIGEFEVLVYATDDGLPAKEASQTIRLAVSEPPPEPVVEEPVSRPSFDEAKYTYVTGIVEVNGRRQVWLTVRTDGSWLRLFEGDTFEIGSLTGKIVRIYTRHVEIQAEETVFAVRFGQSLNDGEVISGTDEEVAATGN